MYYIYKRRLHTIMYRLKLYRNSLHYWFVFVLYVFGHLGILNKHISRLCDSENTTMGTVYSIVLGTYVCKIQ